MPSDRVQRRVERLLDQAEEAVDSTDWLRVRELSEGVLAVDPENTDALSFLDMANRASAVLDQVPQPRATTTDSNGSTAATVIDASPTERAVTPAMVAGDRYRVGKFLGEGGKKRVYLAHDTLLDREVALSLIKTETLDDTGQSRISREAQAMGRLGAHPNIVTVFDLGVDNGAPYLVTELMTGGDVEALLDGSNGTVTTGDVSLERTIEIGRAICEGLQFAHDRDIVHRDLKPGNVWLNEDGVAKIGDFGLAIMTDRSRLTREGMIVGTVAYMPPEQATGGEISLQADLYSLGAMLYEMVTGRPPFLGDDDISVISQHINTAPVAPSWHNPDCPQPMDALIVNMLSKDPSERPASAQAVLDSLEVMDLTARGAPLDHNENALESLAGGVFVGRQPEMDQLQSAFEQMLGGSGRLVSLVGEPGIGKTQLAREFSVYAGMRGATVVWGRCYEERGAPPYCPWLQSIWALAEPIEPEKLRSMMGAGAADIAELIPYLADKLPGMPTPPPLGPLQARFRLFESITRFLEQISRETPIVMVVDDVHWSDESSLQLLKHLATELTDERVMFVLTYRDIELSLRHPLASALADINKDGDLTRVWVRGLGEPDLRRYVELTAGVTPPGNLIETINGYTEGNPLFLSEIVKFLVQEGEIGPNRVAEHDNWSVTIPEGVKAVVGSRIAHLSEECSDLLTIAAVVGREFDFATLRYLSEGSAEDEPGGDWSGPTVEALESAVSARVIDEIPGELGRYRFGHSLIQQTLIDDLSGIRLRRTHSQIAEAIKALNVDDLDATARDLAHHLAESGPGVDADELAHFSLVAGEEALQRFAYQESLDLFERAIATRTISPPDSESARLFFGRGRANAALENGPEAIKDFTYAFDYYVGAEEFDNAIQVACSPVGYAHSGAPELVERALEFADPASHVSGELMSHRGLHLGMGGDYSGAAVVFDQALEIARSEEDVTLEMWTLTRYGTVEIFNAHFNECVIKDGRAVELNQQIQDPYIGSNAGYCVANALQGQGDHAGARSQTQIMVESAERARFRAGLVRALALDAALSMCEGRWDDARVIVDRVIEVEPNVPDRLAQKALLEYSSGNEQAGEKWRQELIQAVRAGGRIQTSGAASVPMLASLSQSNDLLEEFKQHLNGMLASGGSPPLIELEAHLGLGYIATLENNESEADIHYTALTGCEEFISAFYVLSGDRLLGLLASTMGQHDLASGHFEDAIKFCRERGYRPELAWACSDYSDMLLDRDEPGDSEKIIELQDEALALTSELGMRPITERILARREILKA